MTVNLPPAADALFDQGWVGEAYLIRFDLPGKTVGYVHGPRAIAFNGLTYIPNRYLTPLWGEASTGNKVTSRNVTFAGVPTENTDDAIAAIEAYDYQNAPGVLTTLSVDPEAGEIAGAVETTAFEIASVRYRASGQDKDGKRELTIPIKLDAPGRSIREQTAAKTGDEEQRFDNDPTDTGSQNVGTVGEWPIEWGRV